MKTRSPRAGLERLLRGLFDYAGMFPPASLPLEDALRESASFSSSLLRPELVGADLVLPAERLGELTPERLRAAGVPAGRELRVCALGRAEDLAGAASAIAKCPARVLSLELKAEPLQLAGLLVAAREAFGRTELTVFLEAAGPFPEAAAAIAACNARAGRALAGLKVRCAGPAYGGARTLAEAVAAAALCGIPFKATQGLHHPLVERERYGNDAGFLGLAAAVALARGLRAAAVPEGLAVLIGASEAPTFGLWSGLRWKGLELDEGELDRALSSAPFSIGSCSLREPDQDLRRLFP